MVSMRKINTFMSVITQFFTGAPVKVEKPTLNICAATVSRYFENYPYLVEWFPNHRPRTEDIFAYGDRAEAWCKSECSGHFAHNVHRVLRSDSYSNKKEWVFNDLGGSDIWFWAFTKEEDAVMFSLRW